MEKRILALGLILNIILPTLSITNDPLVTDLVYLDMDIAGKEVGRIVIGLFGATSPKTVQNFISLANHEVITKYNNYVFVVLIFNVPH